MIRDRMQVKIKRDFNKEGIGYKFVKLNFTKGYRVQVQNRTCLLGTELGTKFLSPNTKLELSRHLEHLTSYFK